ncbi:hypothetical protein [Agrobacterium tumefaciens]|uniref:hypothetical protein n=1 Tax=Agrobacterium tumefaciens TaxID=358 RepID=UPI000978BBC3|nr:hypothetical protein BV900_10965 [Agrobacterium tumefaciens]
MKTDWNLIREMMGAAIDACERIEAAGYTENDRDASIDVGGQQVSVHDFLVDAWTLPENRFFSDISAPPNLSQMLGLLVSMNCPAPNL